MELDKSLALFAGSCQPKNVRMPDTGNRPCLLISNTDEWWRLELLKRENTFVTFVTRATAFRRWKEK